MFTSIDELDECEYAFDAFADLLDQTQKIVDEFCLHDYSNFPKWIATIDGKIEKKLFQRLQAAILLWKQALIKQEKGKMKEKKRMRLKVIEEIDRFIILFGLFCRKLFWKFELSIKC
jgi:hypothetical protein